MIKLNRKNKKRSGFTLIELLAVVTIMSILFAIGLVTYTNAARNARNSRRRTDVTNIRQALVLYRSDNGVYPENTDLLSTTGYWSDAAIPTDPSTGAAYTYTPSPGGCSTSCTGFQLEATLENAPPFIVTNP